MDDIKNVNSIDELPDAFRESSSSYKDACTLLVQNPNVAVERKKDGIPIMLPAPIHPVKVEIKWSEPIPVDINFTK